MSPLPHYRPQQLSLGHLEAEILNIIWERGTVTVKDVHEQILSDPDRDLAYASVTTVLQQQFQIQRYMGISALLIEIGFNKKRLFSRLDKSKTVCISEKRLGEAALKNGLRQMHIFILLSVPNATFRIWNCWFYSGSPKKAG